MSRSISYRKRRDKGYTFVQRAQVGRGIHLREGGWVVECPCGWCSNAFHERSSAEKVRGAHRRGCPLEAH